MNLLFITYGLPGAAYHGGAITCWSIIKTMLARGHKVTILSLFDNSFLNPYLESREVQTKALYEIGAKVEFIEHKYDKLKWRNLFPLRAESLFPCAALKSQVRQRLKRIEPDAIFCYHFDALSAVYDTDIAPIMAGVGDLWHLPIYYRWKIKKPSIRKYLIDFFYNIAMSIISKRVMLKMLRHCTVRGAFAAHYAEWLRRQRGFADVLYLRTPVYDPLDSKWHNLRREHIKNNMKPKILMIGDITGTAAKWGLKLLIKEILPVLEKKYSIDRFEIHLVGGGQLDDGFKILLEKPYIKIRGRIIPADIEFLNSDILFVPTPISLGVRVKIIIGFAYGLCIVAHKANTAGIPELIHKYNGLIANKGGKLAEELIRAMKDNNLRRVLGKNARRTFKKYFSEDAAATRIVEKMEYISKEKSKNEGSVCLA
jgi:glycosyltransferase involved in cell wall biosynthesis